MEKYRRSPPRISRKEQNDSNDILKVAGHFIFHVAILTFDLAINCESTLLKGSSNSTASSTGDPNADYELNYVDLVSVWFCATGRHCRGRAEGGWADLNVTDADSQMPRATLCISFTGECPTY